MSDGFEELAIALRDAAFSYGAGSEDLGELKDREEACLAALLSARAGYVLVPKEPTLEMCNRGFAAVNSKMENAEGVPFAAMIYRAMIAAAPSQGAKEEKA